METNRCGWRLFLRDWFIFSWNLTEGKRKGWNTKEGVIGIVSRDGLMNLYIGQVHILWASTNFSKAPPKRYFNYFSFFFDFLIHERAIACVLSFGPCQRHFSIWKPRCISAWFEGLKKCQRKQICTCQSSSFPYSSGILARFDVCIFWSGYFVNDPADIL